MKSSITPTIGRIVVFVAEPGSQESSNGATEVPAIIVRTGENTGYENSEVNLKVFCDGLHDIWRTSVPYSEEPGKGGTWHWPPRA